MTNDGANVNLTFASLATPGVGSTLDVEGGVGVTTDELVFTTAPTLTPPSTGIIARITVGGNSFATYGANGLAAFTAYATPTDVNTLTATPTAIASVTSSTANHAIHRVEDDRCPGVQRHGTHGQQQRQFFPHPHGRAGFLVTGGADTLGGLVSLGAVEGIFQVASGSALNIAGDVTGTIGITKGVERQPEHRQQPVLHGRDHAQRRHDDPLRRDEHPLPQCRVAERQLWRRARPQRQRTQYIGATGSGNGSVPGAGGTITSGAGPALLVINEAAANSTWTGSITGTSSNIITVARVGGNTLTLESANPYYGATIMMGGALTLQGQRDAAEHLLLHHAQLREPES